MKNLFSILNKTAQAEIATKMVIMDAIEKGHTNPAELTEYMKSETFLNACRAYIELMTK